MNDNPIRWGILSTAQIARKNWKAIRNTGNATVVAVASRDVERSRRFISDCQVEAPMASVPTALGSYEALIESKQVDAVYIPLPTGLRKEWVLRAAAAGKHVVCEKPCAASVADLSEMLEACRRGRVQFMDGVMFMHSARLEAMRRVMDDPASGIGEVKRIASAFSFRGPDAFFTENIRANGILEPYGCLGDLGWYCIRFALWVMNGRLPRQVIGRILNESARQGGPDPVPTEFSGELIFDDHASAGFYCSFLTHIEQWVQVTGTQGQLRLPDFVLPFYGNESTFETNQADYQMTGCDFTMEAQWRKFAVREFSNSHPSSQETNLFRNFSRQIQSGALNDFWPSMALKTQQIMQACLESARLGGQVRSL